MAYFLYYQIIGCERNTCIKIEKKNGSGKDRKENIFGERDPGGHTQICF